MTPFVEKHCGSCLSSKPIVDTPLISKLFTPFLPICSQFRFYNCYPGDIFKNETHIFQCFSANDVTIKKFCMKYIKYKIHVWIRIYWSVKTRAVRYERLNSVNPFVNWLTRSTQWWQLKRGFPYTTYQGPCTITSSVRNYKSQMATEEERENISHLIDNHILSTYNIP